MAKEMTQMAKKMVDPWQAEDDARILIRHAEVCKDASRLTAAKKVLKKQSADITQALGTKGTSHKASKSSLGRGKPDYI